MQWSALQGYAESDAGYRITWAGPPGARAYTAWAPGKWHAFEHMPIDYFCCGKDAKQQAIEACERHFEAGQKAATTTGGRDEV